jgi:DNA-binding GntR family transcriptional regulator
LELDVATTAEAAKPQRIPRYLQLAGELREAIMKGEFAGGRQFPTETVLCRQYDVSRYTIREALRRLEAEGLIQRRRGSGTTVQPAAARGGALHQPLSNVGELLQYAQGSAVSYTFEGRGSLPEEIAVQLAEPTQGEWTAFRGVRRHAGEVLPIAVTDAYFHERLGDAVAALDLGAGTLFSQIEQLTGSPIAKVTQDIQAIAADAAIADALEVEPASPVLRILRCYYDRKGRIFEISVSHHPGDRFAYAMHIDIEA